jgi:hypothetical protein
MKVPGLPAWASDQPFSELTTSVIKDHNGTPTTVVTGKEYAYTESPGMPCARQIVETDALTGLSETTCLDAGGSRLVSSTDGFGLTTQFKQVDDPMKGQQLTITAPDNITVRYITSDPLGRTLQTMTKTKGYNDATNYIYYDNGYLKTIQYPGASVGAGGGGMGGVQQTASLDPGSLLEQSDEEDDQNQPVEQEQLTWDPNGVFSGANVDYASANGVTSGEQIVSCPFYDTSRCGM